MRYSLSACFLALLVVLPTWGLDFSKSKFNSYFGVSFESASEKVPMEVGQTLKARVSDPERLARRGLAKTSEGDEVRVTLEGVDETIKLRFEHPRSGGRMTTAIDVNKGMQQLLIGG